MRVRAAVILAVGLGALFAFAPVAGAVTVADRPAIESALVTRINAVRRNYGLRPVRVVTRLAKASNRHANSMAAAAYFRHELFTPQRSPDWTGFGTWIRWFYPGPGYAAWGAGENLAWGAPTLSSRQAVRRWMASPTHRANLLTPGWRNVGVAALHLTNPQGYYGDWNEVTLVVADFGRRS